MCSDDEGQKPHALETHAQGLPATVASRVESGAQKSGLDLVQDGPIFAHASRLSQTRSGSEDLIDVLDQRDEAERGQRK